MGAKEAQPMILWKCASYKHEKMLVIVCRNIVAVIIILAVIIQKQVFSNQVDIPIN